MGTIEESLAGVPFFADLSHRDLKRLASLCVRKQFQTGDVMLEEGTVGLGLYLISEGEVEVFKTEDGRRRRVAMLGPGDVLGEMALIDEKPRSASAVATTPTAALLLSRDGFRTVVRKRPAVAWALVPELAARLRDAMDAQSRDDEEAGASASASDEPTAEEEPATAAEPAAEEEPAAAADEPAEDAARCSGIAVDGRFLRAPYAALESVLAGLGGSLRVVRSSGRAFAETTGLSRDGGPFRVLARLPRGAVAAATTSVLESGKIPVDMLDAFLSHLNGGERDEG